MLRALQAAVSSCKTSSPHMTSTTAKHWTAHLVHGGEELGVEVVLRRLLQVLHRALQEQRHLRHTDQPSGSR